MTNLANSWLRYVSVESLDAEAIHERVRKAFADMNAPPAPKSGGGGVPMKGGGP